MLHYSLTRSIDEAPDDYTSANFTDHDPINAAHLIASYFNTVNRPMLGDFVLAVVDTKNGTVQYDGKIEQIKRDEPWSMSQTFTFEPSAGDADTILTLLGNGERPTFTAAGKFSFVEETDETTSAVAAEKVAPTTNRKVLEDAYVELHRVKDVLFDAGVETIPAEAGVRDLLAVKLAMSEQIAKLTHEHEQANAAARGELIKHVRGAYLKKERLTVDDVRPDLEDRFKGMLDILAKFLVAIGEADDDERHAVARRLCGIDDE